MNAGGNTGARRLSLRDDRARVIGCHQLSAPPAPLAGLAFAHRVALRVHSIAMKPTVFSGIRKRLPALRRFSLLTIGMLLIGQRGDALPLSSRVETASSAGPAAPPRSSPPPAFSWYSSFSGYKQHLAVRAHLSGISPSTIDDVIPDLSLNPRVIELDRAQPGNVRNPNANPPFAPYLPQASYRLAHRRRPRGLRRQLLEARGDPGAHRS